MKLATYSIRFLLALIFIYAGIEKLFLPFNPSVFRTDHAATDPLFFEFYELLQEAGYLYFVGFFQFLCGLLMVFKRTYLLGAIMFVPLLLCLLMTHIFFSKYPFYIGFDSVVFLLNAFLIATRFKILKPVLVKPQKGWI